MTEACSRPGTPDSNRPHYHVACAIIEKGGLVLAAQRSRTMSLPLKWEFPGGKTQSGESPADCLQRELREELGIAVGVREALPPSTHHYPTFTVTLYPFRCAGVRGEIVLHEHAAIAWVTREEMGTLDWAEADLPVIAEYLARREPSRAGRATSPRPGTGS
jgi:8-oxo-dGTP diphosphatase